MIRFLREYRTLLLVILALAFWSGVFIFIPPDTLIESIGIGNVYLAAFGVSLVAGFSLFTGTAAYALVIELSRNGANPLYLGLASGIGLFLSDTFFYLLVMRGRDSIRSQFSKYLERLHHLAERLPTSIVYGGIYLFSAFGPIPNDVILAALMLAGYEYRKFWPMLLAGDITFMLFLSYIFQQ